jgi:Protein of unknown function (DUF1616)
MESDSVQSKGVDLDRSELLQQRILDAAAATHKCYKVKDLVTELQQTFDRSLSLEEIQDAVKKLEREKRIILLEPVTKEDFLHYTIRSYDSLCFWLRIAATCFALTVIFFLPNVEPWSYIRILTAVVFVLFLPGNALVQLLFAHRNMEQTEQIVLSVALSMAIVSIIGLILKYMPLGLTVQSVAISVSILSITLFLVAKYGRFLHAKRASVY